MNDITKINLYVDSNYSYYINRHLLSGIEGNCWSIKWANLKKYIELFVFQKEGGRPVINKSSYFVGIAPSVDVSRQDFYNSLECANIERKSFPLKFTADEHSRLGLKEDAVDTTLVFTAAKDFFSVPKEDRYDYMVLFAGDSDFVPLVEGLRSEGVKTIVIYYDFSTETVTTRASQILLDKADFVISMEALLKDRVDENAKAIFEKAERCTDTETHGGRQTATKIPAHIINAVSSAAPISYETVATAISLCRLDSEGYALVARVGVMIEQLTKRKIPSNVKLKDVISAYADKLETKEMPAYSVRIRSASNSQ